MTCDTWHVTHDKWNVTCNTHGIVNIGSKYQVTCPKKFGNIEIMWHVTCNMWHVECDTWHMTDMGCWTLSQNCRIVLFEGFLYIVTYNHMLYPISFHFHFGEFYNPYTDWVPFYLVFSFGQHLLWREGLFFHFLSKNALI